MRDRRPWAPHLVGAEQGRNDGFRVASARGRVPRRAYDGAVRAEPPAPVPSEPPGVPPGWPAVVGRLAALFLGGVLVLALYGKTLDPAAFVELIEYEGLDFLLPATWVAAIGLGLEAVLGFALLFGLRHLRVLIPTTGLVAFFVFLTARTYLRHLTGQHEDTGSCGCFGNIIERTPAEAFWQDVFLLVPPLLLTFVGRPALPMPRERLRWGLTFGLSAAVLGLAWLAPGLPLDDMATKLHPDAKVADLCAGSDDTKLCLPDVIPEIGEGRHLVVLVDLGDEGFLARVDAYNEYGLAGEGAMLWVLTSAPAEDVDLFHMTTMPSFSLVMCPPGLMRPLYRALPRAFVVEDGTVTETIQGWPDLASFAPAQDDAGDGDAGGDGEPLDPDAGDDDPDGGG